MPTLIAPPSPAPPRTVDEIGALHEQALIEEARRRAQRRRRRRYGAVAAVATAIAALAALIGVPPGESGTQPAQAPRKQPLPSGSVRPPAPATDAAITILDTPGNGVDAIWRVGPRGELIPVWSCPNNRFCGDLVSAAWAPDGRHIAFSLTQYGGHSTYPGLHILDTKTGLDRHISVAGIPVDATGSPCFVPDQLAWSPDGSLLAYACEVTRAGHLRSEIHLMHAGSTDAWVLPTGTSGAAWPSWSPRGDRIAFSTQRISHEHLRTDTSQPDRVGRSAIYTIDLHGAHRRLVAPSGVAPTWSPDGSAIAYRSACGRVRIATPGGRDATPPTTSVCPGIGPPGWPAWAPDGSRIAIANEHGIYLVDPDGAGLERLTPYSLDGVTHRVFRPFWQPIRR